MSDPVDQPSAAFSPTRRTVLVGAAAAGAVLAAGTPTAAAARTRAAAPRLRDAPSVLRLRLGQAASERGEATPFPLQLAPVDGESGTRGAAPAHVVVKSATGRIAIGTDRASAQAAAAAPDRSAPSPRAFPVPLDATGAATLWITALSTGEPLEPADRLTVLSPEGDLLHKVDVWVEPRAGHWRRPGLKTHFGRATNDLGIVAVHAALLGGGAPQQLMWSMPRLRDSFGRPIREPDRRPGQWSWNAFALDDVESRTLSLISLRTRDTPLPGGRIKDNIFCAGAAHLPDGGLLVAGGHIIPQNMTGPGGTNDNASHMYVYHPAGIASGWRKAAVTLDPIRWYPTVTTLPDGRMLITSGTTKVLEGNEGDFTAAAYWDSINNDYRIFDPATGAFAATDEVPLVDPDLLGTDGGGNPERLATYPMVFVLPAPGGAAIALAETNRAWLYGYDPVGNPTQPLQRAGTVYRMATQGSRSYPTYGAMVLLPIDADATIARVLAVGGQHEDNGNIRDLRPEIPATATAEILDLDTSQPLTTQTGWRAPRGANPAMAFGRVLCDATLLADGTVLVTGGSTNGWGDLNRGPVYRSEIFDPDLETFTPAGDAATDRRYHSTALLQLDGTLLKAGSTGGFGNDMPGNVQRDPQTGQPWMSVHTDAERYYPPYLWRGPRPVIVGVGGGAVLKYGGTVSVTARGNALTGARLALIRLGAITHGNDMDQRYVRLAVTGRRRLGRSRLWTVTANLPANPASAPPGDYQLVLLDSAGVPSEGRIVRVSG